MHQKIILPFTVLILTIPVKAQSGRKHKEEAVFYKVTRIVDDDTFNELARKARRQNRGLWGQEIQTKQ